MTLSWCQNRTTLQSENPPLKGPIQEFLDSLGGLEAVAASTKLRDLLLATAEPNMGLDWAEREPLRAGMKSCAETNAF
jgi:hypothetical protein